MIYKISEYKILSEDIVYIPKYKLLIAKLFKIPLERKYNYEVSVGMAQTPYPNIGQTFMCGNGIKWVVLNYDNWTCKLKTVEPCYYIQDFSISLAEINRI